MGERHETLSDRLNTTGDGSHNTLTFLVMRCSSVFRHCVRQSIPEKKPANERRPSSPP